MLVRLFVKRTGKESKSLLRKYSAYYEQMLVFDESPRKTRAINVMQLKGSELQTVVMSTFPYLASKLMKGLQGKEW